MMVIKVNYDFRQVQSHYDNFAKIKVTGKSKISG